MITWNYRVFKEANGDYIIREVFYKDDGSIAGCTEDAVEPYGQSLEELTQSIEDMKAALALPVLTLADIPEPSVTREQRRGQPTMSHERVRAELGLDEPDDKTE
jgi:hypothetical protein